MEMYTDVLLVTANVGSLFDNVSSLCLNSLLFSRWNITQYHKWVTQQIISTFVILTGSFATARNLLFNAICAFLGKFILKIVVIWI